MISGRIGDPTSLRRRMKIYTKKGDDGTTGLLFGGRISKASQLPAASTRRIDALGEL